MSTKRILAVILSVLMLCALAVPAFAYETPLGPTESKPASAGATFDGTTYNYLNWGAGTYGMNSRQFTCSFDDEPGALHISNATDANQTSASTAQTTAGQWVNSDGMTFDLYAKIVNLPSIYTANTMTDTGVVSGNPNNLYFNGLVFNICTNAVKYLPDTSKANNEMQACFVDYFNETCETDTALILPYGNRNAIASCSAIVFFFNRAAEEYARYTIVFDGVNKTTNFYINGSQDGIFCNGVEGGTADVYGMMYRATATTNFINVNLNNGQAGVKDSIADGFGSDLYIDQMNLYPGVYTPLDPEEDKVFAEDPDEIPVTNANFTKNYQFYKQFDVNHEDYFSDTYWNALEGWIEYALHFIEDGDQAGLDAIANSGTNGNYLMNRSHWKSLSGQNAASGGNAATMNGTGTIIPAATPIMTNIDKIWISHATDDVTNMGGWTSSANIIFDDGADTLNAVAFGNSTYKANTNVWRVYTFKPTAVDGYYEQVLCGGAGSTRVIPEGGFAIVMHMNGLTNTTILSLASGNASTGDGCYVKYASCAFMNRNISAVYNGGWGNGKIVKLNGVSFDEDGKPVLDTEGTWKCFHDPSLVTADQTPFYFANYSSMPANPDYEALANPTFEAPKNLARDQFEDFHTNAYIQVVDALPSVPTVDIAVEGEGTVSVARDGKALGEIAAVSAAGDQVITLTASGDGFKFWKNAKSDVIISTNATIDIPGGIAFSVKAVFDSEDEENCTVYFKDIKTGKIVSTIEVPVGTVLESSDIPAYPTCKGYICNGWKISGNDAEGYKVSKDVVATSTYVKGEDRVTVTIKNNGKTSETKRGYAEIVTVTATAGDFSYWTLNGKIVSYDKTFSFAAPSEDCQLNAVAGADVSDMAIVSIVDLSTDADCFYTLISRSALPGVIINETGVLMGRDSKISESDLVLGSANLSVTKGASSAPLNRDVVGFQKNVAGKAGNWLVRGYLTYTYAGVTTTVYSDVASIMIID